MNTVETSPEIPPQPLTGPPAAATPLMTEETAARLVALLESIDTKLDGLSRLEAQLDSLHDLVLEMKMDVSGFEHEGTNYPGRVENIESALGLLQTTLESFEGSVTPAEPKAPPEEP